MNFQLSDLLKAIGPNASLVFAAWIFLSFLQARYVAAFDRFRELTNEYRTGSPEGRRHQSIRTQIRLYRRRCELMRWAATIGVVSAILLICTLIIGGLDVVFPGHQGLPPAGAVCALAGLALVIVAAMIVIVENTMLGRELAEDVVDLPDVS